jgi:hypothetical protein
MTMWRLSMSDIRLKGTPVFGVLVVTVGNWNDVVTMNPTVFEEIPPSFHLGKPSSHATDHVEMHRNFWGRVRPNDSLAWRRFVRSQSCVCKAVRKDHSNDIAKTGHLSPMQFLSTKKQWEHKRGGGLIYLNHPK